MTTPPVRPSSTSEATSSDISPSGTIHVGEWFDSVLGHLIMVLTCDFTVWVQVSGATLCRLDRAVEQV
jgi:hypothetical protein